MFREDQGLYKHGLLWVGIMIWFLSDFLVHDYAMYIMERNIHFAHFNSLKHECLKKYCLQYMVFFKLALPAALAVEEQNLKIRQICLKCC